MSLPSPQDVSELFGVRMIVETGIAAQLCNKTPAGLVKRLRKHIMTEQKALAAGDYKKAIALLGEFHTLLAEAMGNKILIDFFAGIVSRTSLIVSAFDDTSHGSCRSDEHITLVDCIERGDVAGAISCVQNHLHEIEAAVTAKAQEIEAGYHPMQHLFGEFGRE